MGMSSSRERGLGLAGVPADAVYLEGQRGHGLSVARGEREHREREALLDHIKTLKDSVTFAREEVE
jgi:hypothetical protein